MRPRNLQTVKPDRYDFSGYDDVYCVEIHELFAQLLTKNAHTGKDELTVVGHMNSLWNSLTMRPLDGV